MALTRFTAHLLRIWPSTGVKIGSGFRNRVISDADDSASPQTGVFISTVSFSLKGPRCRVGQPNRYWLLVSYQSHPGRTGSSSGKGVRRLRARPRFGCRVGGPVPVRTRASACHAQASDPDILGDDHRSMEKIQHNVVFANV